MLVLVLYNLLTSSFLADSSSEEFSLLVRPVLFPSALQFFWLATVRSSFYVSLEQMVGAINGTQKFREKGKKSSLHLVKHLSLCLVRHLQLEKDSH